MFTSRFIPHSVRLKTAGGTDAWVNGIESAAPNLGIQLFEESSGSETDREFVAARDIAPTLPIVTSDLSILSTVGFNGLAIAPGAGSPGVVCYGRQVANEGLPTAVGTSAHLQMACSDGLLVPVSLRAGHNQAAKLSLLLHGILGTAGSSGTTPFVFTSSQAITTGAGATTNIYTTGPLKFTPSSGANSGTPRFTQGIKDLGVEFGLGILKESDSGNVYPSHVSIVSRMTTFEFTTVDANLVAEIGDGVSVSTFSVYFQQVSANGQRVAAATTTHIAVTGTAGMITPGTVNLRHKTAGTVGFTFTPAKNTNLISISTTSAIPTS